MYEFDSEYIWNIKSLFSKIKTFCFTSSILCAIFGFCYLLYWSLIMTDSILYDFTNQYFSPLAHFLSPSESTFEMYKLAGFKLFGLSGLGVFMCIIFDTMKDNLINSYRQAQQKKYIEQQNLIKRKEQRKVQASLKKNFSICLSLDYESENSPISTNFKAKLNSAIFKMLKNDLSQRALLVDVIHNSALVLHSGDFYSYDNIYNILLSDLAKIKKSIAKKYSLSLIPSITTDAYNGDLNLAELTKEHFEIKGCNFKNRALTTSNFSRKYEDIKRSKYLGIPIGEYALLQGKNQKSVELNVVYKNLSHTLNKISNSKRTFIKA